MERSELKAQYEAINLDPSLFHKARMGREMEHDSKLWREKGFQIDAEAQVMIDEIIENGRAVAWQIAESNIGLAKKQAGKFIRKVPPSGSFDFEDLVEIGRFGLYDAARYFDTERNIKFSTFGTAAAKDRILLELSVMGSQVKLSRSQTMWFTKYDEGIKYFHQDFGRPPTDHELAEFLSIPLDRLHHIQVMRHTAHHMRSIDENLESDDQQESYLVMTSVTQETPLPTPEGALLKAGVTQEVRDRLKSAKCSDWLLTILNDRCGDGTREPMTVEATAAKYNLTREDIRKIELLALRQLRAPSAYDSQSPTGNYKFTDTIKVPNGIKDERGMPKFRDETITIIAWERPGSIARR